jgi:PAS domain S-box-containing protein
VRVWSLTVCRWPLTRSASSAVAIEHSAHPTTAIRNIGFVQRSSRRNVTGTPEAGVAVAAALALADAGGLAAVVVVPSAGGYRVTHRSAVAADRFAGLEPGRDLAASLDPAEVAGILDVVAGVDEGRTPSPAALAPLRLDGVPVDGATAAVLPGVPGVVLALGGRGVLHQSEDARLFSSLAEMAPELVAVLGFDGRFRYVNRTGARMLGLATPTEAIGLPLDEFVLPEELAQVREIELATVMRGGTWKGERNLRNRATGMALPVDVTSFLLTDASGAPVAVATIQRDISRRRHAEQQLRDAEGRLRLIVGQVPAFFWTTDRDLRVTELFGQASPASGLTPVGETLRGHWGLDDPQGAIRSHERALAGESVREEATTGDRTLRSHLEPLHDDTGAIIGVIGVALDVTEQRALETQLRHSQKMEAVGQLAGGIAHDYNNMLLGIMGNLDLALLRVPDETNELRRPLLNARHAAERSAELTRRLLTFGRKDATRPSAVDPNDVIRRAAELLGRTLGGTVRVDLRLSEAVRPIWIDPIRLEQVVMNLAINARDAMPGGGTLTFTTTMRDSSDGLRVELAVRDTGSGIPAEAQEHIFEPFFTTKATGSGLGLATVYAVVTESGGDVSLTSASGQGTTIRLLFPPHEG